MRPRCEEMGLIRSGNTRLAPEDDDELTGYLLPIVREMVKTAVENGQNLIVGGCYIPPDWRGDFGEEYLRSIGFVCLWSAGGSRVHGGLLRSHHDRGGSLLHLTCAIFSSTSRLVEYSISLEGWHFSTKPGSASSLNILFIFGSWKAFSIEIYAMSPSLLVLELEFPFISVSVMASVRRFPAEMQFVASREIICGGGRHPIRLSRGGSRTCGFSAATITLLY